MRRFRSAPSVVSGHSNVVQVHQVQSNWPNKSQNILWFMAQRAKSFQTIEQTTIKTALIICAFTHLYIMATNWTILHFSCLFVPSVSEISFVLGIPGSLRLSLVHAHCTLVLAILWKYPHLNLPKYYQYNIYPLYVSIQGKPGSS